MDRGIVEGPRAAVVGHAMPMELLSIEPVRKTGEEPLTDGTVTLGVTVGDFWAWSASDLSSNATRGRSASRRACRGGRVAQPEKAEDGVPARDRPGCPDSLADSWLRPARPFGAAPSIAL